MRISGAKLRRARERRSLTQRELAELAGVSFVTVWRLENEATGPTRPTTVRKVSKALGVSPEDLVVWDDEELDAGKVAAA